MRDRVQISRCCLTGWTMCHLWRKAPCWHIWEYSSYHILTDPLRPVNRLLTLSSEKSSKYFHVRNVHPLLAAGGGGGRHWPSHWSLDESLLRYNLAIAGVQVFTFFLYSRLYNNGGSKQYRGGDLQSSYQEELSTSRSAWGDVWSLSLWEPPLLVQVLPRDELQRLLLTLLSQPPSV